MAYEINYNDERFKKVESEKQAALAENEKLYDNMISESDNYYQAQIDASKQWAETQSQLQQEKTDFAIDKIEQEKDKAQKDYTKEQSGAYVDWQKQSNQYGANAEQMAASGLQKTGFSESSQVSMFTAYQNRVATARESFNNIVLNFNNSITEARIQNNSILAEIAYEAQKQQLELNLQGFQYKNQLLLEKADKATQIDQNYYNRWQDVLQQINTENALAEQIRQFNAQLARSSSGGGGGGGIVENVVDPNSLLGKAMRAPLAVTYSDKLEERMLASSNSKKKTTTNNTNTLTSTERLLTGNIFM